MSVCFVVIGASLPLFALFPGVFEFSQHGPRSASSVSIRLGRSQYGRLFIALLPAVLKPKVPFIFMFPPLEIDIEEVSGDFESKKWARNLLTLFPSPVEGRILILDAPYCRSG